MLLPALSLAEGMASLLDELTETAVAADSARRILCVGARNNLDEAAAGILAYLLTGRGIQADVVPCEKASARAIASLGTTGVDAVVLSSLNPSALGHCRRMLRRLRLHFGPRVPILLCLWSAHPEAEVPERASAETDADLVATGMAGALAQLEKIPSPPRGEG